MLAHVISIRVENKIDGLSYCIIGVDLVIVVICMVVVCIAKVSY